MDRATIIDRAVAALASNGYESAAPKVRAALECLTREQVVMLCQLASRAAAKDGGIRLWTHEEYESAPPDESFGEAW